MSNTRQKSVVDVMINNTAVPLFGSAGASAQITRLASKSLLFQQFIDSIHGGYEVKKMSIVSATTIMREGEKSILFLKVSSTYLDVQGREMTRIAFLRGGAVFVIVTLRYEGVNHILTVKQSRFPAGGDVVELPAGMIDGSNDFASMAIKEMREELQINCNVLNLVDLNAAVSCAPRLYTSPGGSDEFAQFYLYDLGDVNAEQFASYVNRKTGAEHENEFILVNPMTWDNFLDQTGTTLSWAAKGMYDRYMITKDIGQQKMAA